MSELAALVAAIHSLGPVRASTDAAWTRPTAQKVIDCVLSLNRQYDVSSYRG
ncbi:MAG TPA: hypothetical protein VER58_11225 [Thermoanaerobaculia bacterium]|nr:hypothetical protein [Thermoanaerobaculia bacterium]